MEFTLQSNLKILLAQKKMKNKQLADIIDVSEATVSNWINNTSFPTFLMAHKIAIALDCTVNDLYTVNQ